MCIRDRDIDVKKLKVDLLSISAHKIYGPKGIGALYINKNLLGLKPLFHGGSQENKIRPGTLNVAGIVGFGKACEIAKSSIKKDRAHLDELTSSFLEQLNESSIEYKINGSTKSRIPGNLNLQLPDSDNCLLYTSPSPRDATLSRMPSSA